MSTTVQSSGRNRLAHEAITAAGAGFRWWTSELAGMLPSRLRGTQDSNLIVEPADEGLRLGRDTPQGWENLATFRRGEPGKWPAQGGAGSASAILRLPAALVLARTITLAAAAEENVHEVVGFQLDRYTPFDIDEVYLGCRVVGHDPEAEAIEVAIAVASRRDVTDLQDAAAAHGIACVKVVAAGDAYDPRMSARFGLDSVADLELDLGVIEKSAPAKRWRRFVWAAAALFLILDLAVPLVRGHSRLLQLREELATVRLEAQKVAALRDQVDQAAEQAAVPVQRWHRSPLSLLLAELTHLVPDGDWVSQMQIDTGAIQLTGYAASANSLIPILEQSELFTNAAFRSPVTQDPVHGVEQFHLSVDLRRPNE